MSGTDSNINLKLFFNKEYPSLKNYVQSKIKDTTDRDADDIVQEVALKLFSRSSKASPIANIAAFVYGAIRNKIIDTMRSANRTITFEENTTIKLQELSELIYESSSEEYPEKLKAALKVAIGNLQPAYQHIIIAVDFEGYSYKEISIETGIPQGTLMSRRHRALSVLSKELKLKK